MSYEVYIDIKHGDKHAEELKREDTCARFPDGPEPMEQVVKALRMAADDWDPNFVCEHCGHKRGEHPQERGQYLCSRYGKAASFVAPGKRKG